jgi:hypothetical protein
MRGGPPGISRGHRPDSGPGSLMAGIFRMPAGLTIKDERWAEARCWSTTD